MPIKLEPKARVARKMKRIPIITKTPIQSSSLWVSRSPYTARYPLLKIWRPWKFHWLLRPAKWIPRIAGIPDLLLRLRRLVISSLDSLAYGMVPWMWWEVVSWILWVSGRPLRRLFRIVTKGVVLDAVLCFYSSLRRTGQLVPSGFCIVLPTPEKALYRSGWSSSRL